MSKVTVLSRVELSQLVLSRIELSELAEMIIDSAENPSEVMAFILQLDEAVCDYDFTFLLRNRLDEALLLEAGKKRNR